MKGWGCLRQNVIRFGFPYASILLTHSNTLHPLKLQSLVRLRSPPSTQRPRHPIPRHTPKQRHVVNMIHCLPLQTQCHCLPIRYVLISLARAWLICCLGASMPAPHVFFSDCDAVGAPFGVPAVTAAASPGKEELAV